MIRCTQCGARKNRATDPCIYCGANGEQTHRSKTKLLLLIILLITLVATCVLFLAGLVSGDDSAENLVNTWVTAINEDDPRRLLSVFPEIYIDGEYMIPDFAEDYMDNCRDRLAKEYGDDFRVSAAVKDVTSADDSQKDLLSMIYEEADITIKRCKSIVIELTIAGSKKSGTETITLSMIKVDGEWCFNVLDSFFLDF
jgi:hypothetical protein